MESLIVTGFAFIDTEVTELKCCKVVLPQQIPYLITFILSIVTSLKTVQELFLYKRKSSAERNDLTLFNCTMEKQMKQ